MDVCSEKFSEHTEKNLPFAMATVQRIILHSPWEDKFISKTIQFETHTGEIISKELQEGDPDIKHCDTVVLCYYQTRELQQKHGKIQKIIRENDECFDFFKDLILNGFNTEMIQKTSDRITNIFEGG